MRSGNTPKGSPEVIKGGLAACYVLLLDLAAERRRQELDSETIPGGNGGNQKQDKK